LRRYIAGELRKLREARELERKDVAARLHTNVSHVSHLETMRYLPRATELEVVLDFYGAAERTEGFLELLTAAKKGKDWWAPFKDTAPDWFDLFLGQESSADRIESFDAMIVPGLFQTPDYTRAVIKAGRPELTEDEVSRRIELRMARQDVLTRQPKPPTVWRVIDESVLYRPAADPGVLANQIQHLITLTDIPSVTIQIMPLAAGLHAAVGDGTFTVLSSPPELVGDPGVVYTEAKGKATYHEDPDDIARFRDTLQRVHAEARTPTESLTTLTQRLKELT
jgi:transcriptional regulator with XRE-family HTH domain